jgi:pimeloyl-ACP methyl ester carboxylesterase
MLTVASRDGTRIAYDTSGAGPPLVVVNGGLAERGAVAALRPLLEPHFTLIAYDRRGRGDSGDAAAYAPEREVEDLAAVIEAGGAPALVFGHSSGAILALRAATSGVPMRRLAVYEPPFMVPGTRPMPTRESTSRLAERLAANDREGALAIFFVEQVGLPQAAFDRLKASPAWPRMLAIAHTTAYDAKLTGDAGVPVAALAKLTLPTLVLSGTATWPWIAETARVVAEALPNAETVHLEGQAHSPAPDLLAPALVRFFGEAATA